MNKLFSFNDLSIKSFSFNDLSIFLDNNNEDKCKIQDSFNAITINLNYNSIINNRSYSPFDINEITLLSPSSIPSPIASSIPSPIPSPITTPIINYKHKNN